MKFFQYLLIYCLFTLSAPLIRDSALRRLWNTRQFTFPWMPHCPIVQTLPTTRPSKVWIPEHLFSGSEPLKVQSMWGGGRGVPVAEYLCAHQGLPLASDFGDLLRLSFFNPFPTIVCFSLPVPYPADSTSLHLIFSVSRKRIRPVSSTDLGD